MDCDCCPPQMLQDQQGQHLAAGEAGTTQQRTCHRQCLQRQALSRPLCWAQLPHCCWGPSWLPGWLQKIAEGLLEALWLLVPLRCHPPSTFSAGHEETQTPYRQQCTVALQLRHDVQHTEHLLGRSLTSYLNNLSGPRISPCLDGKGRQAVAPAWECPVHAACLRAVACRLSEQGSQGGAYAPCLSAWKHA